MSHEFKVEAMALLILGGILALVHWLLPWLFPWVVAYFIVNLSRNVKRLLEERR